MNTKKSRALWIGAAFGSAMMLCGAAPADMQVQIGDVGPLGKAETPGKSLVAQNAMFQNAPMPDEDVQAPVGGEQPQTQLAPKMLSPNSLFQGDGYSYGSDQQSSLDRRKAAAAGLGLSVPVQQ